MASNDVTSIKVEHPAVQLMASNDEECIKVEHPALQLAPPPRAVLGVIQIATDLVMDVEGSLLVQWLPGVEIRYAKVAFDAEEIRADTYQRAFKSGAIARAVDSLRWPMHNLEGGAYITTWGLSCTSMSFILGWDAIKECFPEGSVVTDMWQSVLAALRALGATKLAMLTPYIEEVSAKNQKLLEDEGFNVVSSMSLGLTRDVETSAVTQDCIMECVQKLAAVGEPDVIFIGCSAFRACTPGFISELEAKVCIPVVTSTQAYLWHMLRTSKVDDELNGYGKLFAEF